LEKIAAGAASSVYKGRSWATGETVAVKVVDLPVSVQKNDVLLRRFAQEFRSACAVQHPNLVRTLDYGQEGSAHYLVMEFIEGESLGDRIERDESAFPTWLAVTLSLCAGVVFGFLFLAR
jgi:serine/threonine protein kinase